MKKLGLIISILLMVSFQAFAPERKTLLIIMPEPISVFDPVRYAFISVESAFDNDTVNALGYGGNMQIGQEMIDEVNRICILNDDPRRFVLNDRLNPDKSAQIWYIVQYHYNPTYDIKKACLVWNPLGTPEYYDRVKKCHSAICYLVKNNFRILWN